MKNYLRAVLAVSAMLFATGASAQESGAPDAAMMRDLAVVQKPVVSLKPPKAGPLKVTAWVDRQDSTYAIGETVKVMVRANRDAYITVVNVGTSGATTVLFPNEESTVNFVKAGQVLTLPRASARWAIQAQGPGGVEVLKVFASTSAKAVYSGGKFHAAGPFRAFNEGGSAAVRDLAVVLNADPAAQWAEYTKLIRVKPFRTSSNDTAPQPLNAGTEDAALNVLASLDRESAFKLDVDVTKPEGAYQVGEPLRLKVTSERDCRLTVLNLGSSGKVTMIFPNREQRANLVAAGEPVVLPARGSSVSYQVRGPAGVEGLVAVCTAGRARFLEGANDDEPFRSIDGGREALERDLAVVVNQSQSPEVAYALTSYRVR